MLHLLSIAALALAGCCSAASAATDDLSGALASVSFAQALPGVSRNADAYFFYPLPCYYLETENVTGFASSWGGPCGVKALSAGGPPPSSQCTSQGPPHAGYDRGGSDIDVLAALASPAACSAACCGTANCLAWVYVNKLASGTEGPCSAGVACCWLKGSVPNETPFNYPGGIYNGVVTRPAPPPLTVPPTGVRNAVPLGGLGAGTLELRGDGTFSEITIHSASPAGSAKYAAQDGMLLAVRAGAGGGAVTRALRTAPPPYAAPGVASITYSGSYPVSQLNVTDPALAAAGVGALSLFAYHHLVPGDSPASAAPAVVFTLTATNAGAAPLPLSLFLSVPMGAMASCRRLGEGGAPVPAATSYAECLAACASASGLCGAWNWNANASSGCTLLPAAGGMVYAPGDAFCGVAGGGWGVGGSDGATLTLSLSGSPASAGSAALGDVSLRAVGGSPAASASSFSLGAAQDPSALFAAFAAGGAFPPGSAGGVTGGSFAAVQAGSGGAVVSAVIPPGATVSQSIVLAWYFPDRDFYGRNIGQFYSTLFNGSAEVAAGYDAAHLVEVAQDAAAHVNVWGGEALSGPDWLWDHMTNQFSHYRNFIYARTGEMREHEANDCPDLDSVHNDYQRHLPYLWAVPEFEAQKSELYESCQQADGMITENPGFSIGEACGGRTMGDTTTIWLLELLEIYQSTGNLTRLQAAWPAAVKGINWQIAVSQAYGIPAHLVCTYDILGMERYNSTTFNGVLHIAAMAAGEVMAAAVGDAATGAAAAAARATAVAVMTGPLMWNSSLGFFRAYTGGDAIMADCLYGQQVALAHGLGWLLPQGMIAQHLAAEARYNANAYGLTVVKGRNEPLDGGQAQAAAALAPPAPADAFAARKSARAAEVAGVPAPPAPADAIAARKNARAAEVAGVLQSLRARGDGQDDSIWMGSGPTWSCLALALGAAGPTGGNVTAALEPMRWILSNYRDRLRSLWDLTGLSTSADWGSDAANGQPFCTSHYGFIMTSYYVVYALSGQQTNIPKGTLIFAPLYPAPYALPWAFMGSEGTLSADAAGKVTFSVAFGQVSLPAGGLAVSGRAYAGAVSLGAGQSVAW